MLDSVYPALAALSAFEAALLNPQSDHQLLWTAQLAHQVQLTADSKIDYRIPICHKVYEINRSMMHQD